MELSVGFRRRAAYSPRRSAFTRRVRRQLMRNSFRASAHPPAIEGINPISPVVSLSLADGAGTKLDVQQLTDPVTITIPLITDSLCGAESRLWTGKGRCMYFDPETQQYSADGCTTVQDSDTSVTCKCTHLTSFVVEVLMPDWFGIAMHLTYGALLTQAH